LSLRKMIEDELERRKSAIIDTPLSFLVAPDDTPGAMTDPDEAMQAAVMVREDKKRTRVPISRAIVGAVSEAAHAANPRAGRFAAIMRVIVAPGDQMPEPTSTTEDPDLVQRIANRIAQLRDD
jgi:hypothetical protein